MPKSKIKYFTVGQLIKDLSKMDPKRIVVLSKDSEGNGFEPLSSIVRDNCNYDEEQGEWGVEKLNPYLKKIGYTEEDVFKGQKAIVLYPC